MEPGQTGNESNANEGGESTTIANDSENWKNRHLSQRSRRRSNSSSIRKITDAQAVKSKDDAVIDGGNNKSQGRKPLSNRGNRPRSRSRSRRSVKYKSQIGSKKSPAASRQKQPLGQRIIRCLLFPIVGKERTENRKRGNWSTQVEFIFSTLGYILGFGNVWRFSFLVYTYGGGSLLISSGVAYLLIGLPLYFLEMAIGQFTSKGPVQVWRCLMPAFEGLGWAIVATQVFISIYYNAVFAQVLYFTFSAMQPFPPWEHCNSAWNTRECFTIKDYENCVRGSASNNWYLKGTCYNTTNMLQFYQILDTCIEERALNNQTRVLTDTICSARLQFQFVNKDELKKWLNHSSTSVVHLFDIHDNTSNSWKHLESTNKLDHQLLSLNLNFNDPQSADRAIHLAHDLMRLNIRLETIVKDYCELKFGGKRLIECSREVLQTRELYSSMEYYDSKKNSGYSIRNLGGFYWPQPLCLLAAWVLTAAGLLKGIKWMGKIVYLLMAFPIVIFVVLLVFSASLNGFKTGILFYLEVRTQELWKFQLWLDSAIYVFFSLSLSLSGLTTLASYNRFRNDLVWDTVIGVLADCFVCFFLGFATFGIIGSMADTLNVKVDDVLRGISSAHELVFVTFAQATAGIKGGHLLFLLFYGNLCILGFTSIVPIVNVYLTALCDDWKLCQEYRPLITCIVCIAGFLLGLPCVTHGGVFLISTVDEAVMNYVVPMMWIVNLLVICGIYGIDQFINDLLLMYGTRLPRKRLYCSTWIWTSSARWYFAASWIIFTPVSLVLVLVMSSVNYRASTEHLQPVIYWMIAAGLVPAVLLSGFLFNLFYRKRSMRKMLQPLPTWGPALAIYRTGKYARMINVSKNTKKSKREVTLQNRDQKEKHLETSDRSGVKDVKPVTSAENQIELQVHLENAQTINEEPGKDIEDPATEPDKPTAEPHLKKTDMNMVASTQPAEKGGDKIAALKQ